MKFPALTKIIVLLYKFLIHGILGMVLRFAEMSLL